MANLLVSPSLPRNFLEHPFCNRKNASHASVDAIPFHKFSTSGILWLPCAFLFFPEHITVQN